jgi:hypothetical protein
MLFRLKLAVGVGATSSVCAASPCQEPAITRFSEAPDSPSGPDQRGSSSIGLVGPLHG